MSGRHQFSLPVFVATDDWCVPADVADTLARDHYLGPTARGVAWRDGYGVLVLASPSSRRLPATWLELTRWCLRGIANGGSRQWCAVRERILRDYAHVTTVVSYSDPAAGHTGALYRACNWLWAPTWHRLRPPPSGNGNWGTGAQAVKDRWVDPLRPDDARASVLALRDESLRARMPWAEYREPVFRRGLRVGCTGGGDFGKFVAIARGAA